MATKVKAVKEAQRLSKNFHRTFIPERQYIGALLKYAAGNGLYGAQAISEATGIPTGKSSGKALPTADYCIGMGLVRRGQKTLDGALLELTDFGRTVFLEDKFLQEEMTQWIAHLQLCSKNTGAEVWYQLFWNGAMGFGGTFSKKLFTEWLGSIIGGKDIAKAIGPTFNMYAAKSSFATCRALTVEEDTVTRHAAPIESAYSFGYAAWMAQAIERAGRQGQQLTVEDLEELCGFRSVSGWSPAELQNVLALLEQDGLVSVDRHMQPWIVHIRHLAADLWKRLFDKCI